MTHKADEVIDNLIWMGLQPLEVFRDTLREQSLTFLLSLDNKGAITSKTAEDPDVKSSNQKSRTLKSPHGNKTLPGGTYWTTARSKYSFAPRLVRVRGGAIYREAFIPNLEPVGLTRGTDVVVPIEDAIASYGGTIDELRRWVMLDTKDQGAAFDGKFKVHAAQIRRWAYRWYRVPERAQRFLPMERYRARAIDKDFPAKEGPDVQVRHYGEVKVLEADAEAYFREVSTIRANFKPRFEEAERIASDTPALEETEQAAFDTSVRIIEKLRAFDQIELLRREEFALLDAAHKRFVFRTGEASLTAEISQIDRQIRVLEQQRAQQPVGLARVPLSNQIDALEKQRHNKVLERFDVAVKAFKRRSKTVWANIGYQTFSGVRFRLSDGLVIFPEPVGELEDPSLNALGQARLVRSPSVSIVFAYKDKPGIDQFRISKLSGVSA